MYSIVKLLEIYYSGDLVLYAVFMKRIMVITNKPHICTMNCVVDKRFHFNGKDLKIVLFTIWINCFSLLYLFEQVDICSKYTHR